MTQIELTTPACLLLGLASLDGKIAQLGITLQYPPIQLLARDSATLQITGGRADLAAQQAGRFFQAQNLAPSGEIEIELAIPQYMGLGSAALMGLTVARAMASLHGRPSDDAQALADATGLAADEALETHAFGDGGLLLVGADGALLRRVRIPEHDEDKDWVFVLLLPRVPAGTPERLERDRRAALSAAAPHIDAGAMQGTLSELWAAVERDDIAAFARAITAIRAANDEALGRAGTRLAPSDDELAILDLMREHGALAWGQALTGLGLYALIEGGGPSRELRRAITERIGLFGGTVMATLADNGGAQESMKPS